MTVRKFRSIEAMSEETWRRPGDPALYRAMAALWAFGSRTSALRFPPGVRRYRSIEEMDHAAELWREAEFKAFQERRASRVR